MARRLKLNDIAVTQEERQIYISQAASSEASYQSALAKLDQARVNFRHTQVRSPLNGYITNLTAQVGDYADVGALQLSIVNSDSYWIDTYFEKTALGRIQEDDDATIKLMAYSPLLRGRVQSSRAGAMSRMRRPTPLGSPRSTRSTPSCASPSACRCDSTSTRFQRRSSSSPA
jgi:multidrug resistance efflux pump